MRERSRLRMSTVFSLGRTGQFRRASRDVAVGIFLAQVRRFAELGYGREHEVVAVPMVVRESPVPIRKVIGDLSNAERALFALKLGAYDV